MSHPLVSVLLYVLFPVGAMIVGGIVATVRAPGLRLGSAIQHFAAGMVFAAVAIELLPDLVSKHAPLATIIGFSLGVTLMLFVRWLGNRSEQAGQEKPATSKMEPMAGAFRAQGAERSTGPIAAVGVDITIDGVLLGIGFVAGARQGILLTVALTLELLSLGLATVTALHRTGTSPGRSIVTTAGLAVLILLGAALGVVFLAGLTGAAFDAVLAFGVAALLYLVTSIFFVGFLLLLMIDLLV